MNWILALFAFAGVMAVMATIVTVIVEAVHKVFGLRGAGLREMLRALHDGVVMPLDPGHPEVTEGVVGGATKQAAGFAKEMTQSPSYGGKGRWWWVANIPLLNVFRRRFENLSKLQFVEQLSQTDFGQRIAGKSRQEVRGILNRLVYEFDRYGVGQSDFFRARAKVFTSIIALLIVSLGNINAIAIYRHLAADQDALNFAVSELSRAANIAASSEATSSSGALAAVLEQEIASANINSDDPSAVANFVATKINDASSAGFPVGRDFFPYCRNMKNQNCDVHAGTDDEGRTVNLFGFYESAAIPRMLTPEGAQWFLGMVATAGMIGLGAPFWFGLFRAMASLVVRMQPQLSAAAKIHTAVAKAPGEVRRPREANGSLASPGEEPDLDVLTDAFFVVSGKDVSASAPMGRRFGDSTSDRLGPAGAQENLSAPLGMGGNVTGEAAPAATERPKGIRQFRA